MVLRKIVSGGQTGVDRAALDAAQEAGIETGGWCPAGRRAEDGTVPSRYTLEETPEREYSQRTEWNVRDSEGTLILHAGGALEGGTRLTREIAAELERPILVADVSTADPQQIRRWLETRGISVLNVAGPRESEEPGVYTRAADLLRSILDPGTVT